MRQPPSSSAPPLSSFAACGWCLKGALLACQPLDVAATAWLLITYAGLGATEANPIVEPLTGSPWGLVALGAIKIALAARLLVAKIDKPHDLVAFGVAAFAYLLALGWNTWLALEGARALGAAG